MTTSQDNGLGGRLTLLDPSDLSPAQQRLHARLTESRVPEAREGSFVARLQDGRFIGPFNGFLHVPEIAEGLLDWADAQVEHSGLSQEVRQVVILTVAARWRAPYELYAHEGGARRAGVTDPDISALIDSAAPSEVSPDALAAHRVTASLVDHHALDDALYATAVDILGVEPLLAVVHLAGQYMTISALLVAAQAPVPVTEV